MRKRWAMVLLLAAGLIYTMPVFPCSIVSSAGDEGVSGRRNGYQNVKEPKVLSESMKSREKSGKGGEEGPYYNVIYGIGSTSKVVTAAAVMKLSEEGAIDLDEPLITYLPEFEMDDARCRNITPRMLLDHSSGLPGSTLVNAMLLNDPDTYNHDHLLKRLKGQRLKADPGACPAYCNDGFTLAEILVERVSSKTFTEYVNQTFSEPLGLTCFGTPQSGFPLESLAPVYDNKTGWRLPAETVNVIGSGGIYGTAEDLCRFAQVFMENGRGKSILSKASLEQMKTSTYGEQMKVSGHDTTLEYGLGWDSVNTYPFNRYGIQALTKGGDTSCYHASLTVLPEEGISCAILSSGGSSTINQIAVQEILLDYLDEIDRIERSGEKEMLKQPEETAGAVQMRRETADQSGWYVGKEFFQVDMGEDGTLSIAGSGDGYARTQTYQCGEDGKFYSSKGSYISMGGELAKSGGGKIGTSELEIMESKNGEQYLMAATREIYPGLGTMACYLPLAVRMRQEEVSPDRGSRAMDAWKGRDGKEYYLVSDKYSSTAYFTRFMVKPKVLDKPDGYLVFEDSLMSVARIKDPGRAEFFQQIPGQAGRDLSDYVISEQGGKEYLNSGSYSFISEDSIGRLPAEDTAITIGADGEAVWFATDGQHSGRPLVISVPEKASYFVYDHGSKKPFCAAGSYLGEAGHQVILPKDGRIVFVGEAGTEFTLHYAE